MTYVPIVARFILTGLLLWFIWRDTGLWVAVGMFLMFTYAEGMTYLVRLQSDRIDALETALMTSLQSVHEHLRRRDVVRRTWY